MTRIEAAEDSFARANTYFILTWVVTSLVIATAFVDYRSHRRDVAINDRLVEHYSTLERLAAEVARDIRSAIYLAPNYTSERAGIESLRRLRSGVLRHVVWFETDTLEKLPDLALDERKRLRSALKTMKALLLLNDVIPDEVLRLEDEPSLLLAEHQAGTYLVTDQIEDLRIEDAARYLWLSSLELPAWNAELSRHRAAIVNGSSLATIADDLVRVTALATDPTNRKRRKAANDIWVRWLQSTSGGRGEPITDTQEKRRRVSLTLAQTSEFLEQAYRKKAELDLRAGGQASTIELPILALPLQLRDAVLVAPWALVFCSLAIVIYTKRAIRYAPQEEPEGKVVGNVPAFCAFYGLSEPVGVAVAAILLLLPVTLMAVALPLLLPSVTTAGLVEMSVYFGGTILAVMFGIWTVVQLPYVFRLIDEGVAVRE
jgi:hypothetical protein